MHDGAYTWPIGLIFYTDCIVLTSLETQRKNYGGTSIASRRKYTKTPQNVQKRQFCPKFAFKITTTHSEVPAREF